MKQHNTYNGWTSEKRVCASQRFTCCRCHVVSSVRGFWSLIYFTQHLHWWCFSSPKTRSATEMESTMVLSLSLISLSSSRIVWHLKLFQAATVDRRISCLARSLHLRLYSLSYTIYKLYWHEDDPFWNEVFFVGGTTIRCSGLSFKTSAFSWIVCSFLIAHCLACKSLSLLDNEV